VHAAPNLGRKDQGVGMPLCELMVDGLGMDPGLNSIVPAGKDAGKDADMEVVEPSEAAAVGAIGMRQSESQDETKIER
jgi:hypothetical protein